MGIRKIINKLKGTGFDRHLGTAVENVGVVAGKAQKLGANTLDAITRQNIDDQIKEHIQLQNHYNDILAMKLKEALDRIERLERKMEK